MKIMTKNEILECLNKIDGDQYELLFKDLTYFDTLRRMVNIAELLADEKVELNLVLGENLKNILSDDRILPSARYYFCKRFLYIDSGERSYQLLKGDVETSERDRKIMEPIQQSILADCNEKNIEGEFKKGILLYEEAYRYAVMHDSRYGNDVEKLIDKLSEGIDLDIAKKINCRRKWKWQTGVQK